MDVPLARNCCRRIILNWLTRQLCFRSLIDYKIIACLFALLVDPLGRLQVVASDVIGAGEAAAARVEAVQDDVDGRADELHVDDCRVQRDT